MKASPRYNRTFTDFLTDDPSLKDALDKVKKFVADIKAHPFRDGYCLTLAGKSGTGKTMLTEIALAKLGLNGWGYCDTIKPIITNGRLIKFTAAMFNIRKVSDGFKDGRYGVVEVMEEQSLRVMDDVGADHDPSRVTASKIDRVLRSSRGKWSLVTVNLSLKEIAEQIDARIADFLIRDDNKFVEIKSDSFALRKMRNADIRCVQPDNQQPKS